MALPVKMELIAVPNNGVMQTTFHEGLRVGDSDCIAINEVVNFQSIGGLEPKTVILV